MKLQLKCDGCGKVGTADDITSDYDNVDRCVTCALSDKLARLKAQQVSLEQWLETTHLKNLRNLKEQIAEIEREVLNEKGPSDE